MYNIYIYIILEPTLLLLPILVRSTRIPLLPLRRGVVTSELCDDTSTKRNGWHLKTFETVWQPVYKY